MTEQMELPFAIQAGKAFTPNAPIDERALFAGRSEQVNKLLRTVAQKGQHAVLFGERGVGKTSLANVLATYMGSGRIVAPRVNCDALDTFDTVWRKVLDEIQLSRQVDLPGYGREPDLEPMSAAALLPEAATPESVRRALTIVSRSVLPILIIDEFDRLERAVKRQMADGIKTLSDHAVNVTVILVGVADSVNELIEEHQSVERAIEQVPMPRMGSDEIRKIITTGLDRLGMDIDHAALEKMVRLAQGLPHYAHLLGLHAAEIAHSGGISAISGPIVDQAIASAIGTAQQSIKTMWHTATSSPRKDNLFAEVLVACALAKPDELGYFAAQDVREPLREILKRPVEIANYAQHLSDFCGNKKGPVLQRKGDPRKYRFRFVNPLFQPYVVMQGFASGKILQ